MSTTLHHVDFAFGDGTPVVSGLDATFPDGSVGLIGDNGTGKSTILALLAGELVPTAGSISAPQPRTLLHQDVTLDRTGRVRDALGVSRQLAALRRLDAGHGDLADVELVGDRWDLEAACASVLERLGLPTDLDRELHRFSGGEVVLLSLAGAVLTEPRLLLLDEPTNNLDRAGRRRVYDLLADWSADAVVVSHDRELLDRMPQIAELRAGRLRFFGGNLTHAEQVIAAEQEALRQDLRDAESDLRKEKRQRIESQTKIARRERTGRKATAEKRKPKIIMGELKRSAQVSAAKLRAGHLEDEQQARDRVEEVEGQLREDEAIRIDLPDSVVPPRREVARLDGVVLRNGLQVDLSLRGPERLAVVGNNGSGKTTLFETLTGALAPLAGKVQLLVPCRVLPQRLSVLADEETPLSGATRLAPQRSEEELRAALARFRLRADHVVRRVADLSGGERFRASLAALLLSEPAPQLLVLDEPTNSLDLSSVDQLVEALAAWPGALLVASHDRAFLDRLTLTGTLDLSKPPVRWPIA